MLKLEIIFVSYPQTYRYYADMGENDNIPKLAQPPTINLSDNNEQLTNSDDSPTPTLQTTK